MTRGTSPYIRPQAGGAQSSGKETPVALFCRVDFGDPGRFGQMRIYIPKDKLRSEDFLKWVPSGVGALGELQAKGYAYIKVG